MAINTTTTIAGPVNFVFQTELLRNAKALCPYYTGTNAGSLEQHRGTFSVKWRRIENLTPTTSALTELSGAVAFPTRTGSSLSVTDVEATVQKYGDFVFLNEEIDLKNFSGQQDKIAEVLGIQAGRSLNRLQRNVAEDNLTAVIAGTGSTASVIIGSGTASGFLTRAEVQVVTNALDRQDAMKFRPMTTGSQNIGTSPIRSSYVGLTHPDVAHDLRVLTGFIQAQNYAGQTELYEGEIGYLDGVRFIETTESSIDATSGAGATGSATIDGRSTATRFDLYNTVIYGRDCLGSVGFGEEHVKETYTAGDKLPAIMVINHARGSAGAGDPLNELSTLGWKTWHAGAVLNSNWGRVVRHAAHVLDSAD